MKVGQRVVLVSDHKSYMGGIDIGGWFILSNLKAFQDGRIQAIKEDPKAHKITWNIHPDDFITEEIYNSPLYQALL